MSNKNRKTSRNQTQQYQSIAVRTNIVPSLLDAMVDNKEYSSIVDKTVAPNVNLLDEVVRSIKDIEDLRNRPCLLYVGNVISSDGTSSSIDATDDLPFQELVKTVPADQRSVDVVLATSGGSGEQITRFVQCLRRRFDEVNFLIPSFCMSAGTLFALSGDNIYMTKNACLGPIDPQVPSKDGRYVPAQALLLLVSKLQKDGEDSLKNGTGVPWAAIRLIDSLDKKELGAAISASDWSKSIATQFLNLYKFKNWVTRQSSGTPVTDDYRLRRAEEVAEALVSHDRWKSHGHAISREVLWDEIKLKVEHPDDNLERLLTRQWALITWLFDKTPIQKMICSTNFRYVKFRAQP